MAQRDNLNDALQNEVPVPEGFTLSLALVDTVPVLMFCAAAIAFGARLQSALFVAGATFAFLGGTGKVSWKLVIALAHRNIPALSRQMRVTMPLGFVLMIAGVALKGAGALTLLGELFALPSLVFLIAWILCMCLMGYFAGHRDQTDVRSNWIEQGVNALGQTCLLIAVLLA